MKAAEITPSEQYHLGFTMRFPRALAIRDDLSIADCMTATGESAETLATHRIADLPKAVLESLKNVRKRKMEEKEE